MNRDGKLKIKDDIGERFGRATAVVLTEYRGLTMGELTVLRTQLREADAEFKIAKNRIVKIAAKDSENFNGLSEKLTGPTGLVFMYGDAAAASKAMLGFNKTNEKLVIKSGVMEGKDLSFNDMKALAELPSKEVLLSQIVGSLKSPHRGLVMTLSGITRNLVQVINAIKDTKQG